MEEYAKVWCKKWQRMKKVGARNGFSKKRCVVDVAPLEEEAKIWCKKWPRMQKCGAINGFLKKRCGSTVDVAPLEARRGWIVQIPLTKRVYAQHWITTRL